VAELEITQVRSLIGAKANQRATVRSLGLRKLHQTVVQPDRPEIRGMVAKVAHLVQVRYQGAGQVVELEPGQQPKGEGAPAAGASVPDEEAAALREAEAEALAVPGQAAAGSVVALAPGLTATDAPDAPEARTDASDEERALGVEAESSSVAGLLPHAVTAPLRGPGPEETGPQAQAPEAVDRREAAVVDDEALADPRGDLDQAVAAGDLPATEAQRAREELARATDTVGRSRDEE